MNLDLVAHPICLECLDRLIENVKLANEAAEKTQDANRKMLASMDTEIKGLTGTRSCLDCSDDTCAGYRTAAGRGKHPGGGIEAEESGLGR